MNKADQLDLTILKLIHTALRRDLARLGAALRRPPIDSARAQALDRQWQVFADQLHGHHTVEDTLVWPALDERAHGAASDVLSAMLAEHGTLDPRLESTGDLFARFAAEPSEEHRGALATALDELTNLLEAHLQHEERDAIPLIERYLTPADLDRVSATQRREAGLRGARQFLPWVLEGAPHADRADVLADIPRPLRLLLRRWQRTRDREIATAFAPGGSADQGSSIR